MKKYELTIVTDGKATPAKKKAALEAIKKMIATFKGKIIDTKAIGEKELAYPMKKKTSGEFTFFDLELDGDMAKGLALKLRLEEDLLRHLLVTKNG